MRINSEYTLKTLARVCAIAGVIGFVTCIVQAGGPGPWGESGIFASWIAFGFVSLCAGEILAVIFAATINVHRLLGKFGRADRTKAAPTILNLPPVKSGENLCSDDLKPVDLMRLIRKRQLLVANNPDFIRLDATSIRLQLANSKQNTDHSYKTIEAA